MIPAPARRLGETAGQVATEKIISRGRESGAEAYEMARGLSLSGCIAGAPGAHHGSCGLSGAAQDDIAAD